MTQQPIVRARTLSRPALEQLAGWLAVGVAVSLPWSTSATSILIALWLIAVLPTLDAAAVRHELLTAAGGLPVLLWMLAVVGMLWADVEWRERFGALAPFHRLLVIPLLLAQFRHSEHGLRVLYGFFASVLAVLFVSWVQVMLPGLPWHADRIGVPVKDYILQSGDFLICASVLLGIAFDAVRAGRWRRVVAPAAVSIFFLANIAFVVTGRTALLVAPVLVLLLGWRQYRWKGLVGAGVLFCVLSGAVWLASPYLRARMITSITDFQAYRKTDAPNSTALHLEFIKKSLSFVETAPIFGHGTGSIEEQFRKAAAGQTGAEGAPSVNPHNQILAVAIQLGLIGAAVLIAMWLAHFMLFRGGRLVPWIGIVVVTDNVVSSLVNSHLFDFTQAWLYIFGVGVTGGMALRARTSHETDPAAV